MDPVTSARPTTPDARGYAVTLSTSAAAPALRRARMRDGPAFDHVDDLCPGCGGPLEAVADLSELAARAPCERVRGTRIA
jgi:hypothetical protein